MESPKHLVCMQGVEGFVADYGDLQLAIARAKELCTPQAGTFVLSPVRCFRRQPAGRLVEDAVEVEMSEGERQLAHQGVVDRAKAGRREGPTTEELHGKAQ